MTKENLAQLAWDARKNSYSPYSKHKVGAAIRFENGKVFTGCNVENSSFGGSICAERTAVFKAISEMGADHKIVEVAVATDANPPWPPCGICRQILNEFATDNFDVHFVNANGIQNTYRFRDLLPISHNKDAI